MKRGIKSLVLYVLVLHLALLSNAYPNARSGHAPASQQDATTLPTFNSSNKDASTLAPGSQGAPGNAYINPDTGLETKQHVHKRNLVAASKNIRDALVTNDIGLEDPESSEAKKNVQKRNLVGLNNRLRDETIPNDADQIVGNNADAKLNVHKRNLVGISSQARDSANIVDNSITGADSGESKPNIRKRNLVAEAANLRDNPESGESKPNMHKRNLVGEAENTRNNPDLGESKSNIHTRNLVAEAAILRDNSGSGESKSNVRKRNLVAQAAILRDNAASEESKPNIHKRNLVAESAQKRDNVDSLAGEKASLDPASIELESKEGKNNDNIRQKKNLIALAKNARDSKMQDDVSEDSEPSKVNKRRNIVGEANAQRTATYLSGQKSLDKDIESEDSEEVNLRKRNIVGLAERQRVNQQQGASININEDAGQPHQKIQKRNRVAEATNARDSLSVAQSGDITSGKHAPNSATGLLEAEMQSDSGDTKHDIRRGASKLMTVDDISKQSVEPDGEMEGYSENDPYSKLPKARASSLDYPMRRREDDALLQRVGDFAIAGPEDGPELQPSGDAPGGTPAAQPPQPPADAGATPAAQPSQPAQNSASPTSSGAGAAPAPSDQPLPLPNSENTGQTAGQNERHEDHGFALAQEDTQKALGQTKDSSKDQSFTLFTIANTDIGVEYGKIPFRERYLWDKRDAPCHSFNLKVPDETEEKSMITLCIYRPNLEFPDETKMFILNSGSGDVPQTQQKVFGYVMNTVVSAVYGRIVDRFFYGEVSVFSESTKTTCIFVVEQINLLNRLMRNNQKTLKHMLMVMHGKGKEKVQTVYNAVVTKGASLIDFMLFTNPTDINRNSFIMLSTDHNSYICPGEPQMKVDENGHLELESGTNKISVEDDGSVHLLTKDKAYTFRPHGRTIISEGRQVKTLQEHEGSVAITAFTATSSYDCVLPSPAFQPKRRGGYVCKVCIAMDDLFTKHFIERHTSDKESSSNYLGRIIDRVSWIFRSIDFDEDKRADNIGLDYDAQSLRWTYPDNNNEDLSEQDIEVLFQSLTNYDFTDCCLAIGFTMKNFPENENARRPLQSEKANVHLSGICGGKIGRIPSNLMIISANDKRGKYGAISEKQLTYLTANQIASSFGAMADGAGADVCDQFTDDHKVTRHFLMWPDVLRNTTLKEQSLSSCSKKDIVKTLSTCKSSCFDLDRHPFCGNGIVEEGEECDCGSEYNCKLQTCCYSRIGKHPCRKSGVGCKAESSSSAVFLEKALLLLSIGLLAIRTTSLYSIV